MIDPIPWRRRVLCPAPLTPILSGDRKTGTWWETPRAAILPIHLLKGPAGGKAVKSKNDFIYLVDVEKREERKLCYRWDVLEGGARQSQDSHPIPALRRIAGM